MASVIKNGEKIEYNGVLATYGLSNTSGIAIYEKAEYYNSDDEIIIAGYNYDKPRAYKVYYEMSTDRVFFRFGRIKVYLDECLLVNR